MIMTLLGTAAGWFLRVAGWFLRVYLFYAFTTLIFPIASVWQERSIWKARGVPSLSLWGQMKVYVFNVVWMFSCLVGSTLVILRYLLTFGRSDPEYDGHVRVEHHSARLVMALLGNVKVVGEEHLPKPSLADSTPPSLTTTLPAPVYIANHSSQIDVGAVYLLNRRFKWIAKSSVKYLPGVGQIMVLGGHVLIDRKTGKNRNSVSKLYEKSNAAVQGGISMFFFPQGTRRIVGRLPFKDGAFNVALHNKSTLIPVSVDVPANMWNDPYPLSLLWGGTVPSVTLTVHKPIPLEGTEDKEALKEQCSNIIYSVLPTYGEGRANDETKKAK